MFYPINAFTFLSSLKRCVILLCGDYMAFDGFFIHYLTTELNQVLQNVRIKKIRQPQTDVFIFSFFKQTEQFVRFSLNPAFPNIRVTTFDMPLDEKSNLLSALKRHLENALITEVTQYKKDRVVIFHFSKFDQVFGYSYYKLIFESMGRVTNLILTKDGKIIDAYYKQFSPEKRSVLVGGDFDYFTQDKIELTTSDTALLETKETPKEIMDTFMGLSLQTATFLYNHRTIDLYNQKICPSLFGSDKKRFSPIDMDLGDETVFDSLSLLLEALDQKAKFSDKKMLQLLEKEIKRLNLKDKHLNDDLTANLNFEIFKRDADIIYMSNLDLSSKLAYLDNIQLDEQKTLNKNAQSLYHKYHKAKKAIIPIKEQIEKNNQLITYYETLLSTLSYADKADIKDIQLELIDAGLLKPVKSKQKPNKSQKPKFLSFDYEDFSIHIGKSAIQNAYLTNSFAVKTDYWFHVQQGPGAHVILRGAYHEKSLRYAAMYAAYYSPNRDSSSIPVDYTLIRNIKKINGLPGYNVRYENQKTIYIDIDLNVIKIH